MEYFSLNGIDFSKYVNELKVNKVANYNAQTNAAGNTVVDFINHKRTITVGLIPLDPVTMAQILNNLEGFNVSISFRNPLTNELETGVNCIIPDTNIDYYTIQADKVLYKACTLAFIEL